ncbi:MAG: hypothetical protein WBA77_20970 [Microcoleaceae cyanobacterium]
MFVINVIVVTTLLCVGVATFSELELFISSITSALLNAMLAALFGLLTWGILGCGLLGYVLSPLINTSAVASQSYCSQDMFTYVGILFGLLAFIASLLSPNWFSK